MLRKGAHEVINRRVSEAPNDPEQEKTPHQAKLTDQFPLRVATPPELFSECERKRDRSIEKYIFQDFERLSRNAAS